MGNDVRYLNRKSFQHTVSRSNMCPYLPHIEPLYLLIPERQEESCPGQNLDRRKRVSDVEVHLYTEPIESLGESKSKHENGATVSTCCISAYRAHCEPYIRRGYGLSY